MIYGASEITIPQGTDFDVKDTRFRVFAKDFEDGDLTQSIVVTENVNEDAVGTYTISYSVEDQHGNETQLSVPVNVVSAETNEITVKRLMYTIPNVSNMDQAGTNRNNYGDRQHLGIYLPTRPSPLKSSTVMR